MWDPAGFLPRLKAMAEILTPVAIMFGLFVARRRAAAADKQAETARDQAHVTEQGQVTERFTRAMEMLGDEDRISVRLGGIYALERVAKDSPNDQWTVMEVLCSQVQAHRLIQEAEEAEPVPKDIQAILTVLSRRDDSTEESEKFLGLREKRLDL